MADSPDALVPEPLWYATPNGRTAPFWLALALAVLLHGAPFLWFVHSPSALLMQRIGERDGDPEAIAVEVTDEATLASMLTPPPPPSPEAASQQEAPAMKPPPPEKLALAVPEPPGDLPPERPQQKKPTEAAELMKEMVELFAPEPSRNNTPRDRTQPRDPSEPRKVLDTPMEFQANSSSVARPVDITRSGENDEFGRNVIKALRQTMPNPYGLTGRVTIKFLLSETGQIVEMQLVRSSGYPILDQSIVLAASRTSFPVPPRVSKLSDRVFLVTYIYER